ncbi:MAG: hypothetical protein LBQ92_01710 [Propionibacteriaceae bacterium]|jgi:hypothetical protein|nr:hypothetical protein [Propionibacteriaceae bacterium]
MKKVLTALLGVALGASLTLAAPAAEAVAPAGKLPSKANSCAGVWVVVDTGTATTVRCATKYSTGLEALKSAGFTLGMGEGGGFVCQINANPSKCDYTAGWWSYWHATQNADGTWGAWSDSQKGAGEVKGVKGVAEGWRLLPPTSPYPLTSAQAPSVKPPKGFAKAPVPTISGTAKVGSKLTAKAAFSPKPSYTYQWYRSGKKISGAVKSTYKLAKADKGKKITVTVTASKSGYATTAKTSKATAAVK